VVVVVVVEVVVVDVDVVDVLVLVVEVEDDVVVDTVGNVPDVCGAVTTAGCVVGVVVTERRRLGTVVGVVETAAFTGGSAVVVVDGTVVGGTVVVVEAGGATTPTRAWGELAGFPERTRTAATTTHATTTASAAATIRIHAPLRGSSSPSTKYPPCSQNSLAVSSGVAPDSSGSVAGWTAVIGATSAWGTAATSSAGGPVSRSGGNSSRMWKSISSWSSMPPELPSAPDGPPVGFTVERDRGANNHEQCGTSALSVPREG
jgi:hypothetical protein